MYLITCLKFWSAVKFSEETYTLFGSCVKNLFLYYKVARRDNLIYLLVFDRTKQTLNDACLRHVRSAEGNDWFHPEKLTVVVDTYVNSRFNMDKPDFAGRAVLKSLGTGSGVQDTGGINERFYTPGETKSPVYAGENKPPK